MSEEKYDLIVIGGGPGGYVGAIRASQLGLKTALIESTHLGGICLNWGCIPTKALLRSAELFTILSDAEQYGLSFENCTFDSQKIIERSRQTAAQLAKGVQHLLKKNNITLYEAQGKMGGRQETHFQVLADQKKLLGSSVILATGARARDLPTIQADGKDIWNYRQAMTPEVFPTSILIIGSGAIGIEFASFYNAFKTHVTVVEVLERILPAEDEEISTYAQKSFEKKGIKIKTSTTVQSLIFTPQGIKVLLKNPKGDESLIVEKVILAVGIVGNTENLGLEKTKIKVDRGHIVTDPWGETDEKGIYAIGDVAGAPWLAHKASHEAILAVEHIAGVEDIQPLQRERIPGCTYSHPQIASIGLSEQKARAQYTEIKVGRFPFMANGKAIAMGETEGFIKTIFHGKTGELLGAHMIGSEVTELIQGYAIALASEATNAELKHTIFPHPTLSEMMHESVLDAYGHVIHF